MKAPPPLPPPFLPFKPRRAKLETIAASKAEKG